MAKKKLDTTDEVSLASLASQGENTELMTAELVTDISEIEELSEEAKALQKKALTNMRERAMTIIDHKKIPAALKEISSIETYSDILSDPEVLAKVKENIKTPMDLKFLAETQKIALSNIDNLMRMGTIDNSGHAGEVFVGVEFGSQNGTTKIVVGKK